jgi:hypothetical protein
VGNLAFAALGAGHLDLVPRGRLVLIGSGRVSGVQAYACLNCGFVKLYTEDVDDLRRAAAEHPEWFRW